MTTMEIARRYDLLPKDVTAYIQANATFPVKRNFQTGDMTIPDNIDVDAFFAPLLNKLQSNKLQQLKQEEEAKAKQESLEVETRIRTQSRARQELEQQNSVSISVLKQSGAKGYYQYKVISLTDVGGLFSGNSGRVNTEVMTQTLNALGMEGWHLVTAYSNELGKNALSGGAGGVLLGTNSTVDENILIFERFVSF